ncbi:MAG: Protein of unknown function (DUF3718) [Idiomarinaceae bacterium HL-53]|nr:MAG: Protein of unknown function (DUF3718) [Idiomarinaceae bacterium HL-53]
MLFGATVTNFSVVAPAQAQDALAQNLCTYVQGNDRLRMRQRLREERLQLRRVYESILCNGMSLLQFSMDQGADDIGEFIVSQLPGSAIEAMGDLEWAESNGHGDSPVAQAIRDRIGS